jgi:hypothetical protein
MRDCIGKLNWRFMTVTNNIYQKQIKYHVFNAVTNSELTELVPVFTIRPAFPTFVKKVNASFSITTEFSRANDERLHREIELEIERV